MIFELCIFIIPFIFVWLIISLINFIRTPKDNSEKHENAKTMFFISAALFGGVLSISAAFQFIKWLLTTPIFHM